MSEPTERRAPTARNSAEGTTSGQRNLGCLMAGLLEAVLALSFSLTGCGGGAHTSGSLPLAALGGSNYAWYHLGSPCDREPFGVVYNYDTAKVTIDAQLQEMYNNASGGSVYQSSTDGVS